MLAVQSTVTMFDELLALMRLNLKMHRVPSIAVARVVGADAFQYHDRHKSIRRKGIRSAKERKQFIHTFYLDIHITYSESEYL